MMTQGFAMGLMLRLSLATVVISCAEILYGREDYTDKGLLNWEVIRTIYPWYPDKPFSKVLDRLLRYPRFLWLVSLLLLIAVILTALTMSEHWTEWLLTGVVILWLLIQLRLRFGLDGADQMSTIVLIALWLCYLTNDKYLRRAALTFIALQLILSYITAGSAKLLSKEWRNGSAISGVLRTRAYGTPRVAEFLQQRPRLARAVCYSVIGFECLAWISIFGGPAWCIAFLICGAAFHIATALLMGLNAFLWSFLSTFPAVLVLSQTFGNWVRGVT